MGDDRVPPDESAPWEQAAISLCRAPHELTMCPVCGFIALAGEWQVQSIRTRVTLVTLHCAHCGVQQQVQISLPEGAIACWPLDRLPLVAEMIEKEAAEWAARYHQHAAAMPAAVVATHPLWAVSQWSAVTYQWHPTSAAPPVMGLVFDNEEAGLEIFRDAKRMMRNEDQFDELRVCIIEGSAPGQEHRPGYSLHISADPDALAARATFDEFVVDPSVVPFLGQWNRHFPVPGAPQLLPRFKQEYHKHREFMLAPTVIAADGQRYMEPRLGIIKKIIHFRELADIQSPADPDATALILPQVILPPE